MSALLLERRSTIGRQSCLHGRPCGSPLRSGNTSVPHVPIDFPPSTVIIGILSWPASRPMSLHTSYNRISPLVVPSLRRLEAISSRYPENWRIPLSRSHNRRVEHLDRHVPSEPRATMELQRAWARCCSCRFKGEPCSHCPGAGPRP